MSKRCLTKEEIEDILSIVETQQGIPLETAETVALHTKKLIKDQLEGQKIYPSLIPLLKKEIERQYHQSKIQAGESVGIIAGQSIGERQTQSTLNTFHFTGQDQKLVTAGVPRVEELLNATKDPKNVNCTVYLTKKLDSIQTIRSLIGHDIVELTLEKLSTSFTIEIDKKSSPWYEPFKVLYNDRFTAYTDCLTVQINIELLYEYNLTLENIATKLEEEYEDIACVFSSDKLGILDVFIDTSRISLPTNRLSYINDDNVKHIYIEEVVQPLLYSYQLFGLQGIKGIYYNNTLNSFETDGSNFRELLKLRYIDKTRLMSNNMWDI